MVGVLSVIAGAIVLAKPDHSLSVLVIVSGIYIVLSSVLELWSVAFVSRSGTAALFGVLGIVIGILLDPSPDRLDHWRRPCWWVSGSWRSA